MPAAAPPALDIYREIVLDHSRHPRNQRRPERFDRDAEGHNTLCGDKIHVYLQLRGETLADVAYEASGCAICLASASLMTEATRSGTVPEVIAAINQFTGALNAHRTGPATGHNALHQTSPLPGDLAALGGVSAYPSRVRCATLPWETLRAALVSSPATVTTEK